MAYNNISDYLNQITQLHKSSIEKENAYVTSNILNSDCIEFRMKGFKPMGKNADGEIQGLSINQTFTDIKDILSTFGNVGNKEYNHPVEYFINLVKFCRNNNITFEGYNKHTDTRIPLSLNEIYEAIESEQVDDLYPGITDEVKDMARENHSCYYGVDMLVNEYNIKNNAKNESEREQPLYKKDVDALRANMELDFYNKKIEDWNNLHKAAVENNIKNTTTNKGFAVRAYGNGRQTSPVFDSFGAKKIKSDKSGKANAGDVLKKVANAYKDLKNEDVVIEP